jgi:hypothetical protein
VVLLSGSEIQVILNKLENLKESQDRIEKKLDEKCDNCIYVPTFRERLKSQWTHIMGIWAIIGAYFGYLLLRK